jgi:hypothetical protein
LDQSPRIVPRTPRDLRARIIHADPRHYAKNPDLCLLPNGRLLCTFTQGDQHVPFEYARVVLMESADGSETWTAPRAGRPRSARGAVEVGRASRAPDRSASGAARPQPLRAGIRRWADLF